MRGHRDRVGTCGRESTLQLEREQQVGELALAIRAPRPIAARGLQVVEVDAPHPMGEAADVDDSRVGRAEQHRQQMSSQCHVPEMVRDELQLESVDGLLVRRRHHTGVVHQQVEALELVTDLCRRRGDRGQGRHIEIDQRHRCRRRPDEDLVTGRVRF